MFPGEPATLRAAWSAKGNTRQHSVATLVYRYGIPPSGVRDRLVDYLSELKPGMDYASTQLRARHLEGAGLMRSRSLHGLIGPVRVWRKGTGP